MDTLRDSFSLLVKMKGEFLTVHSQIENAKLKADLGLVQPIEKKN
jgi:hypothetical protein